VYFRNRREAPAMAKAKNPDELMRLANIGPRAREDLKRLGIETVGQLALCEPDELYARLNELSGQRHDPCVWDVFAAAIHQARTGEAMPWWRWTPERKRRQTGAV
jgi:hypothetical protein